MQTCHMGWTSQANLEEASCSECQSKVDKCRFKKKNGFIFKPWTEFNLVNHSLNVCLVEKKNVRMIKCWCILIQSVIPIWCECTTAIYRVERSSASTRWIITDRFHLYTLYRGDWTVSTGGKEVTAQRLQEKKSWQAVPTGGRRAFSTPDYCTTWIRHCSTCLLISSSLPANGALHSGHTWPPSSGFLLFILPIRAGHGHTERKRDRRTFKCQVSFKRLGIF